MQTPITMGLGAKQLLATLCVICCLVQGLIGQVQLEFRLHAPNLPDSVAVFITGDDSQLGNWDPARMRMDRIGPADWTFAISLPADQRVRYKYTLGTWGREGLDARGNVLPNFEVLANASQLPRDTVLRWLDGQRPVQQGQVTGTLRYHRGLKPQGLAARDVVVWLPPGYDATAKTRYPVLYMHDGQNIFDPATSSFGVDWQIDETCDSLISAGIIPPMIVVGVYNSSDRRAEYSPGEKGEAYMDFLIAQLKPLIDDTYMTLPDRKHTYVGGSSMGGLISFMLCWEHPEVFSKAICMSPAFQFLHFDYLPVVQNDSGSRRKVQWYIDNGGKELELELQPGVDAMLAALAEKGYRLGKSYFWVHDPEAKHFEAAWAKRMPHALELLLGN